MAPKFRDSSLHARLKLGFRRKSRDSSHSPSPEGAEWEIGEDDIEGNDKLHDGPHDASLANSNNRKGDASACGLCALIVQCAKLARVNLKQKGLCYAIQRNADDTCATSYEIDDKIGTASLQVPSIPSVTKWRIWFYENKSGKRSANPSRGLPPQIVETAVGSWIIETVQVSRSGEGHTSTSRIRLPVSQILDVGLIREWLRTCHDTHAHGESMNSTPSRLSEARSKGWIRAIHTSSGEVRCLPENASYVALSYIWGAPYSSLAGLPRTVTDATELTRQLGYEWLWVDRLCIRQEDDTEKHTLVPIMRDIFALAELTIVAAAGKDARSGLRGRSLVRSEQKPFRLSRFSDAPVLPAVRSFNYLMENTSWRTRGWTFEEYVFSRRLLYVFEDECIFSCPTGTYRESQGTLFHPGSAGSSWGDRGMTPPTIEALLNAKFNDNTEGAAKLLETREFVRAVEEYTSRNLSLEEDRVQAFAGLITDPTTIGDDALLLHGQPFRYFETALTWQQEEKWPLRQGWRRPDFAPSWSWASAGTKVYFFDGGYDNSKSRLFEYSRLNERDVLGMAVERFVPPLFTRLVGSRNSNAAFIERFHPDGSMKDAHLQRNDTGLPRLHLFTIVFQVSCWNAGHDGQYVLRPETFDQIDIASITIDRRSKPLNGGAIEQDTHLCALVGGRTNFYLMLLFPHGNKQNLYVRGGLCAADLSVLSRRLPILKPRWGYIRIA